MNYLVLLGGLSGFAIWWFWFNHRRYDKTGTGETTANPATPAGSACNMVCIEETVENPMGIRGNVPGILYQVKLLMLFVLRGLRHGLTFSLGSEVTAADKFDDIVFSCYRTDLADPDKEYRFLQAKHRLNETKKIRSCDLLQGKDFGIPKYFTSYLEIKSNPKFNGKLKDFIICTNVDVDAKESSSVSEIHTGSSRDIILSHKKEGCKLYKIEKTSDIYKKLLPLFKKDHPNVSDEEINDFFDKFVLAVNQPNIADLGDIISDELGELMNLVDGKVMASQFLESMLDWLNEKYAKFLHPTSIKLLFQSLQQKISRTSLIGVSLLYKLQFKKPYLFKDDVKVIKEVNNFFNDEKKQILTVYYKIKELSAMKILQSREHSKLDEDIVCEFKNLQQLVDSPVSPIEAFRSDARNNLVIVVDEDTALEKAQPTLKSLFEAVNSKVKKRIVLVISQKQKKNAEHLFQELSTNNDNNIAIEDNDNNLSNLTDESVTKLLNEREINFHGRDISLCTIIGDNKELIHSDTLLKLIDNTMIVVGTLCNNRIYKETKNNLVDRTLQRRINISENIFKNDDFIITYGNELDEINLKQGKEIVLISDDEDEFMKLCSRHSNRNIHWLKKEKIYSIDKNKTKKESALIKVVSNSRQIDTDFIKCQIIILISHYEQHFTDLREQYSDKIVYWFRSNDGQYFLHDSHRPDGVDRYRLIIAEASKQDYEQSKFGEEFVFITHTDVLLWQRTDGEILKLRKYITNVNMREKYKPHDIMSSNENTVIIAAEPSLGKSTLFIALLINLYAESKFKLQWIVKIVLKDHLYDFTKWIYRREIISKIESIQLLYKLLFENKVQNINDFLSVRPDGEVSIHTYNVQTECELDSFEVQLFTHFFNQEKIVIYFDGFDEISAEFKSVVLDFMDRINETKVQKLWVTTRRDNDTNILENRLRTFAYEMVPPNENEQTYMFNKLWEKKNLKSEINKPIDETIANITTTTAGNAYTPIGETIANPASTTASSACTSPVYETIANPATTTAASAFNMVYIEETVQKLSGIRISNHGIMYQAELIMLFILRARRHGLTFSLGTDVIEAGKFDDIVFSCYKTGLADPDKEYRFLQAKHRQNKTKNIRPVDLIQGMEFGIPKYFTSYLQIKGNPKFNGILKDFIICTNMNVDAKVLSSVSEIHTGSSRDILLSHKKEGCKLYKITKTSVIYKKLLPLFKKDHPNVPDIDINEFFDKLVLAVNQPNVAELRNIISDELSELMNVVDGKLLASWFLERVLNWMNENVSSFLHPIDIEQIFQSLKSFAR